MGLKLEVGKYYRDAEGARRGPMKFAGGRFFEKGKGMHTDPEWVDDGLNCSADIWLDDIDEAPNLIAEWTDAAIATLTEIADALEDQ